MNTPLLASTFLGLLLLQCQPTIADEQPGKIIIAEETVRIISERSYANLLRQAHEKGWRYPRKQIEAGFRRHFEELKLQLLAQGFTIVYEDANDEKHPAEVGQEL
ncbi:MAG: hypothetical protein AAAB35_21570 [Phyllobacterium sp.]|uniref:hypothetical protein n=1 Tax=Phyllobacterium sp. TaxID=1871046 RepID=UPI0030F26FCC